VSLALKVAVVFFSDLGARGMFSLHSLVPWIGGVVSLSFYSTLCIVTARAFNRNLPQPMWSPQNCAARSLGASATAAATMKTAPHTEGT
jgi:hypothetical protein